MNPRFRVLWCACAAFSRRPHLGRHGTSSRGDILRLREEWRSQANRSHRVDPRSGVMSHTAGRPTVSGWLEVHAGFVWPPVQAASVLITALSVACRPWSGRPYHDSGWRDNSYGIKAMPPCRAPPHRRCHGHSLHRGWLRPKHKSCTSHRTLCLAQGEEHEGPVEISVWLPRLQDQAGIAPTNPSRSHVSSCV